MEEPATAEPMSPASVVASPVRAQACPSSSLPSSSPWAYLRGGDGESEAARTESEELVNGSLEVGKF
eukprot:scaffold16430_cov71-Phaeocystis_antarctica.AAC.3